MMTREIAFIGCAIVEPNVKTGLIITFKISLARMLKLSLFDATEKPKGPRDSDKYTLPRQMDFLTNQNLSHHDVIMIKETKDGWQWRRGRRRRSI